MPTLQSKPNPGSRRTAGDAVLSAAKSADVAPIKKRLTSFRAIHLEFSKADARVSSAEEQLRATQRKVGELDVDQDVAIDELARQLVADGANRIRPFANFGLGGPDEIKRKGNVDEAKTIEALVARVRKSKPGVKVVAACARAEKAAKAVRAAAKPLQKLAAARHSEIVARDALGVAWEKAFVALKNGARAAEDDGASGLFATLFSSTAPARVSRTRVKPSKTTPGGDATTPAAPAASP